MAVLGFVQAAPAVWVLVVWALILVLGGGYTLGEFIRLLTGKQPLWKRVVFFPARVVAGRIEKKVRTLIARASHQFVLSSPAIARQLHRFAARIEDVTGEVLQLSVETYEALHHLRTTTIPVLIQRALNPIEARLDRHTGRLDALEDLNRRVAVVVGTGLRSLPWGVPGTYVGNFTAWWNSYTHLWEQVFKRIAPRVNTLWNERVENLRERFTRLETQVTTIREQALPAIRQRLGRIEETIAGLTPLNVTQLLMLLDPVFFAAAVAAAFRTRFGNLTCRNVTDVTGRVCAQNEQAWAQLLAGTLIFAVALNPREVAAAAAALTGILGAVINETVGH